MILHLAAWSHLVVMVQTLTTHSCLLAAHKHKLYLSLWKCNATFHEEPCMVNDRESINHKFGPQIGNQVPVPQKVAVCGSGVKESRECQYVDNIYATALVLSWTAWSGTDPNRIRHAVVNDENESMHCSYIRQREKPKDCTEAISDGETLIYPHTNTNMAEVVYCNLTSPQKWKPKKDCTEVDADGITTIYPYPDTSIAVSVYCNLSYSGGGWTVLQKRYDGSVDFYRTWAEYEAGFGDPAGEHWLGLAALHAMTNGIPTELYIGLTDHNNVYKYANYGTFSVKNSANKYQLNVGSYSGTAGDCVDYSNGYKFTTHDQDNDIAPYNCAVARHGAWWYRTCTRSNLNGQYSSTGMSGVQYMYWDFFNYNKGSMKTSVMMFRPLSYTQP